MTEKVMSTVCMARYPVRLPQSSHGMVRMVSVKSVRVSKTVVILGLKTGMEIVMVMETEWWWCSGSNSTGMMTLLMTRMVAAYHKDEEKDHINHTCNAGVHSGDGDYRNNGNSGDCVGGS
jgi:hypothetical protein